MTVAMIFDLTDDLQIALRNRGDGHLLMTLWDDRLEERRYVLEWERVQALADLIQDFGRRFGQ